MSWKKKIALGFAALLGLVFLFLLVEHFRGKWGLARWKARMAAKGEPLTIAQASPPPVPTNGMGLLIAAISNITMKVPFPPPSAYPGSNDLVCLLRRDQWATKPRGYMTWRALGEELAPCEVALANGIHALQRHVHFRADLDYEAGSGLLLPHLAHISRFINTLCASALYEVRQSNVDVGVARLEAAIHCLAVFGDEPLWVSQMARAEKTKVVFAVTWHAAHAQGLQDIHLRRLQEAWSKQDFIGGVPRAFSMEQAMLANEFVRFRESDKSVNDWLYGVAAPPPPPVTGIDLLVRSIAATPAQLREIFHESIYSPLWKFAWSRHDELRASELIEERIDAARAAIREQSAVRLKRFGDAYDQADRDERWPYWSRTPYGFLRYRVSPQKEASYSSMHRPSMAQTLRELAVAGLALKRYQLHHENPRPTLEILVPEFVSRVPRDFMDGGALKYKLTATGVVFYSAGDVFWPDEAVGTVE
jgi:hypothetical protein